MHCKREINGSGYLLIKFFCSPLCLKTGKTEGSRSEQTDYIFIKTVKKMFCEKYCVSGYFGVERGVEFGKGGI